MAVVKVTMNFEPNKVNIQKKNCRVEGKETVCINATMCFHVKLKSKEDSIYEAGKHYGRSVHFQAAENALALGSWPLPSIINCECAHP